ncbi:MAG: MBOAT family O-acyltransferase [Bacillota bacterium]|nr:MBOAT family O-acyltransferase [Bacillota bacterium]
MAFTSFIFLVFVAVVVAAYYLTPIKGRWMTLLAASYAFYLISSPKTFVFVILTTVITFLGGRYIGQQNDDQKAYLAEHKDELTRDEKKALKAELQKKKRKMVALILIANFGVLAILKYFKTYIELAFAAIGGVQLELGILIPLGISFYTFQSAAYILDLYRNKISHDTNIAKFALFMSFFPQIIQGPIARHDQLAAQLYEGHRFSYENFTFGMQLILWGFFKKLIIADRVAILTSEVFDNYTDYAGGVVFVALLFYTIQIYADFSGGIDIARGVAQMMGIEMSHNFMRPYFSESLSEFWRRWHMSLSFWTRDYIFYSIALSKFFGKLGKDMRKVLGDRVGKLVPVIIAQYATFITIGLWHGAEFKYVAYGLYNGTVIVLALLLEPYFKKTIEKLHINESSKAWKLFQIVRTFFIVVFGRMFAKATSFGAALYMYGALFRPDMGGGFSETILTLGLTNIDFYIILFGCIVWFILSLIQERGGDKDNTYIRKKMAEMALPLRWAILLAGFVCVLVLGVYGPGYDASAFIYRGF